MGCYARKSVGGISDVGGVSDKVKFKPETSKKFRL